MPSFQLLTLTLLATAVSALADNYQLTFTLSSSGAVYQTNPGNGLVEYGCTFYCAANGTVTSSDNTPLNPGSVGLVYGQDGLYFSSGEQIGGDAGNFYFDPNTLGAGLVLIAAVCFNSGGAYCVGASLPPGDPNDNIGPFGSPFDPNVTIVGTPTLNIDGTFTMDFYNTLDYRVSDWYGVSSGEWFGTLTYQSGFATIVDTPVPEPSALLLFATAVTVVLRARRGLGVV